MIVFEACPAPSVRGGELEVAGRRVSMRAFPYQGEVGEPRYRFDPADGRVFVRKRDGRVTVGPEEVEAWRAALRRPPGGAALVGPCHAAEEIRGSFLAAAEGARAAGRGVYLLDPETAGLPAMPGSVFVALFVWSPGREAWALDALGACRERGFPSGILLPVVPGWTGEHGFLGPILGQVRAAGAQFLAPFLLGDDGETRSRIVAMRSEIEPSATDRFFEQIHHGDWASAAREGQRRVRQAAARCGLASIPPRPVGLAEAPQNAAAAARLEEKAQEAEDNEHRASLLHAAARWIDEAGRGLEAVVREGNFGKVFPFGEEVRREAERAFGPRQLAPDRETTR